MTSAILPAEAMTQTTITSCQSKLAMTLTRSPSDTKNSGADADRDPAKPLALCNAAD